VASQAKPAPASVVKCVDIPDFAGSKHFGSVAKYMIAWENVIGNILSENGQFSIAHTLETETDLSCSIHLAGHLYYRQAFQVLRGFVESFVLPLHFCNNLNDLEHWKESSFHTPPLRGKSGLLSKMVKEGVLPPDIADSISASYGKLNEYIHGSESALNNGGVHSGNWYGHVYRQEKFEQWADTFSEVVKLGIKVLKINLDQWDKIRVTLGLFCSVCHSQDLEQSSDEIMGEEILKCTCRKCGSKFSLSINGSPIAITSIDIDE
jgi:hypothetical protein